MELFKENNIWPEAMQPLIEKYKHTKHPLQYKNKYQLLIMVVLSAQDSDAHINAIAPTLFSKFPDMKALNKATTAELTAILSGVRFHTNKIIWLQEIASIIKEDENIPLKMESLVSLKGIGRKSANVMRNEFGREAAGVIVDLHVIRVAPRLGIAKEANKIEKQLMQQLPQHQWGDVGMAISHLGRETCRPSNPKHNECIMRNVCQYYIDNL